jgi:hypothetical protein
LDLAPAWIGAGCGERRRDAHKSAERSPAELASHLLCSGRRCRRRPHRRLRRHRRCCCFGLGRRRRPPESCSSNPGRWDAGALSPFSRMLHKGYYLLIGRTSRCGERENSPCRREIISSDESRSGSAPNEASAPSRLAGGILHLTRRRRRRRRHQSAPRPQSTACPAPLECHFA